MHYNPEWFQSLFYWMIVLKNTDRRGLLAYLLFQSLFYWMIVLKASSNTIETGALVFQSLFYWMIVLKKGEIICRLIRRPRFNPCFIG